MQDGARRAAALRAHCHHFGLHGAQVQIPPYGPDELRRRPRVSGHRRERGLGYVFVSAQRLFRTMRPVRPASDRRGGRPGWV